MSTAPCPIEIVHGQPADLRAVNAIISEAFDPRFGEGWTPSQCMGMLALPGVWFTLACIDGRPVGFALARTILNEGELLLLATLPTMRRIVGEKNVISPRPQMGAEDFSRFQQVIPGFFYFLGVGNKARGITGMIHTPEFDVDEESLVIGVRVMANVLLDYLDRR